MDDNLAEALAQKTFYATLFGCVVFVLASLFFVLPY
jgi:hypothetical protein